MTGNWPTPPDADPESSLIGQSYVCSVTSNFPMVVTDPGSWVWAGGGVHAGASLPGLVGPEFDQVNPAEPTPRPIEVLARSPVSCGAAPTYSDVSYYVAAGGAGVFDAGTEDWMCALPEAAGLPGARPARGAARHPGRHGEHPHRVRRRARGPRPSRPGAHPGNRRPATPARDHLT